MRTVLNKTHRPLRIRLSKGVLHLGPGKEGQISNADEERESVQKLVSAGEIEVLGQGSSSGTGGAAGVPGRRKMRGHRPGHSLKRQGDR